MAKSSIKNLSIIFSVVLVTLLYSIYERNKVVHLYNLDEEVLMVDKLPAFEFRDLDNQIINNNSLESDKSLVAIHFWGTWCPPCIPEFPEFIDFARKFEDSTNVKILVVAVNDDIKAVKKFLKGTPGLPKNIIVAVDPKGEGMSAFGTVKVPETHIYLNSKSAKRFLGPQKWQNTYYSKLLRDLI